jgi:hypothetical protein
MLDLHYLDLPGCAVCTDFVVVMETLPFWFWQLACASGPLRAAEEGGACAERDDAHSDAGHEPLRAMEGVAVDVEVAADGADNQGDGEVEQEQEPEHRLAIKQGGHDVLPSGSRSCESV